MIEFRTTDNQNADHGLPGSPEAGPAATARPTVSVRDLEARLRRYNSDLDPESETFKSACILMSGMAFGHNVDLLARRTGYPRALVARVARRLIDNGVWKAGETAVSWTLEDEASGTFWNDVAVAEGKMCRRTGPDGQPEWAPAGFWNKSFHFVDPEADGRLSTLYLDPDASESTGSGSASDPADGEVAMAAVTNASRNDRAEPAVTTPVPETVGSVPELTTVIVGPKGESAAGKSQLEPGRSTVPGLDDLFGNVVWIG